MSDYVHNRVVRLPLPEQIISKCDTENDDPYDFYETYLKDLLGELWGRNNKFTLTLTDKAYYIDWVYYHSYGEESGDFGFSRLLTEKELRVIKPYFNKLCVDYKDEDLRVVDYCYYNCCDEPDYYSIEENDDSHLFLSN